MLLCPTLYWEVFPQIGFTIINLEAFKQGKGHCCDGRIWNEYNNETSDLNVELNIKMSVINFFIKNFNYYPY